MCAQTPSPPPPPPPPSSHRLTHSSGFGIPAQLEKDADGQINTGLYRFRNGPSGTRGPADGPEQTPVGHAAAGGTSSRPRSSRTRRSRKGWVDSSGLLHGLLPSARSPNPCSNRCELPLSFGAGSSWWGSSDASASDTEACIGGLAVHRYRPSSKGLLCAPGDAGNAGPYSLPH